jgi:hypothetical protein
MAENEQTKTETVAPEAGTDGPTSDPEATADMLTRLADAGEHAVRRFGEKTGLTSVVHFATSTRDRLDEVATRLKSVARLETRVTELEAQVADLSKDAPKRKQAARSGEPSDAKA